MGMSIISSMMRRFLLMTTPKGQPMTSDSLVSLLVILKRLSPSLPQLERTLIQGAADSESANGASGILRSSPRKGSTPSVISASAPPFFGGGERGYRNTPCGERGKSSQAAHEPRQQWGRNCDIRVKLVVENEDPQLQFVTSLLDELRTRRKKYMETITAPF